ncbi:glycosyltransferase [Nonomuraea soli]|uniref:Cellulose synthase/poly-beta-1,6-N-acetylglucosamine synthase-like glycosyltransferase n=1 Tax=Nonomuraea soli TaxID=1032476 RepID=A0A7W0CU30_9ACTN|nr:glycosyltransferase family 2 protein [Nonomuraea soli]MBA2897364.1 cellulose synthase/poly-beta-1,6-N-acetylglucosamine synthase-like glycosyltransferase [Nonomuraea soli]
MDSPPALERELSVAVLIPAHNEAGIVGGVVRSVLRQTHRPAAVIVIADSCTDTTAQEAAAAGARVIVTSHASKAANLNEGLALITTDLVVGIDGDTELAADAIEHMVATIAAGYDGTCGAVLPHPSQPRTATVRARSIEYALARRLNRPAQSALGRLQVLSGAVFCYRVDAVRAIGGFPVDVPIGEDGELTWRLQGAGYKLGFTRAAAAWTTEPETWGVYLAQVRRWAASSAQILARHPRQLLHPARALIVGAWLFDLLGVSASFALALMLGIVNGPGALAGISVITPIVAATSFALAAAELGVRQALTCTPAAILAALLVRWVYIWALFRELVLGMHLVAWTGRQGRRAQLTPMTDRRRWTLTLLLGVTAAAAVPSLPWLAGAPLAAAALALIVMAACASQRTRGRHSLTAGQVPVEALLEAR